MWYICLMAILLLGYLVYLVLYGIISYAIIYHFTQFRIEGDKSGIALTIYITLSLVIILSSFLLLKPV